MSSRLSDFQRSESFFFLVLTGYLVALLLFIFYSQDAYLLESRIVAWVLFVIGTFPALQYVTKNYNHVPIMELILLVYVNAFSLPLFFQDKQTILVKTLYPGNESVTQCLLLATMAIITLRVSYKYAPILLKVFGVPRFHLVCSHQNLFYYGSFLCVLSVIVSSVSFGPIQGLVNIIASEDIGVALLALLFYKGLLNNGKKKFVVILMLILVFNGVASGMVEAILKPLLIWYICRWIVTRKFEFSAVVIGVVILVLLQPVKLEYRSVLWGAAVQLSGLEKIETFSDIFYDYWLSDEGSGVVDESTYSRTSLLLQTAHVIDWTPNIVPFRDGETLSFMFVSLIPRFIWPDKPTAQQANIYYAIDYGITTEEGTKTTMFGVGILGEAFMNFGVFGIIPIYIVLGILSYLPLYLLFSQKTNRQSFSSYKRNNYIAPIALLVAVIIKFLMIGSAIGDSYGGFIQLIIVQGGLLYMLAGVKR